MGEGQNSQYLCEYQTGISDLPLRIQLVEGKTLIAFAYIRTSIEVKGNNYGRD
jgi:hypothetical protein